MSISPSAFHDSYVSQVCGQAGIPVEKLQTLSTAVCHAVAVQLLGPVQAVALAGEAIKTMADPSALDDLDRGMRNRFRAQPHSQVAGDGADLLLSPDSLVGYGASTSRSVLMPQGFAPLLGHAVGDFIVGHELGHVKALDVLAGYGRQYLGSQLTETARHEVEPILADLNRQAELEADRSGLGYALSRGHSPADLQTGVTRFFGLCNEEESDSHPSRQARIENLAQVLRGAGADTPGLRLGSKGESATS